MRWYTKKADITLGEVKTNKWLITLLTFIILSLVTVSVLALNNQDKIYDYFVDPHSSLKVTSVDVEVGKGFNALEYVNKNDKSKLEHPKKVSTEKVGKQEIKYISKNNFTQKSMTLTLNVVDKTDPVIELKQHSIVIERDKDKVNAKDYIKEYSDNYDDKDDLELSINDKIDYKKDVQEVVYEVKDKSGNVGKATLSVVIKDPPPKPKIIEKIVEKPIPSVTTPPSYSSDDYSSGSSSSNDSSSDSSTDYREPKHSSPYISGVRDISVPVGTSPGELATKLVSGVSGSGYVSVSYSSVNTTVAGNYTVTYSSDDGATETATVTVYE